MLHSSRKNIYIFSIKVTIKVFCNIDYGVLDILVVYMGISPLSVCVLTMELNAISALLN
jgi:hypothetical protein